MREQYQIERLQRQIDDIIKQQFEAEKENRIAFESLEKHIDALKNRVHVLEHKGVDE